MIYRALAGCVVAFHLGFVLFVVLGGLLALRWPRVAWAHLSAAAWGAIVEFSSMVCPLTPLENRFRRLGGDAGYSGGFIEHYMIPVLYPAGLSPRTQVVLGVFVVGLNLAVYWVVLKKRTPRTATTARTKKAAVP